jgi:hypothetical protein
VRESLQKKDVILSMKVPEMKTSHLPVLIILVILVIFGSWYLSEIFLQPADLPRSQIPAVVTIKNTPEYPVDPTVSLGVDADYCYIEEVHPDLVQNKSFVHIDDDDLKKFPQYEQIIENGKNNTQKWYSGHRTVSDFHDYQHQFAEFRNLSCKDSPDPACTWRNMSGIYEYEGQYYEASCLPGFGSHKPPTFSNS